MRFHRKCEWTICGWYHWRVSTLRVRLLPKLINCWLNGYFQWFFGLTFTDFKPSDFNWITPIRWKLLYIVFCCCFFSLFVVLLCTWAFAKFVCYNLRHLASKRKKNLFGVCSFGSYFFGHAFYSDQPNKMWNIKINYFVISKIMADERI